MSTHLIENDGDMVVKRFTAWDRQEHRREWDALVLLAEWAPDLAATPIRADLDAEPPMIVMSRVPGRPLGTAPMTPAEIAGLIDAIHRLHAAIPDHVLSTLRPRVLAADAAAAHVAALCAQQPAPDADRLIHRAFLAGAAWLADAGTRATPRGVVPVFGHGDPNLANYLWDGQHVRLVDLEDSGVSDRVFELAVLAEHLSVWRDARMDIESLLPRFGLTSDGEDRLRHFRRLWALFWLILLLPGGPAYHRNPEGTPQEQARRLLLLLDHPVSTVSGRFSAPNDTTHAGGGA